MATRRLPQDPSLENLKNQAKSLYAAYRDGDQQAADDFAEFHPRNVSPEEAQLTDAQLVLARSYNHPTWPRLASSVQMLRAMGDDDVDEVRRIISENPEALGEDLHNENWGPPMAHAANLGKTAIVEALHEMGATDLQKAFGRAALQGRIDTARRLREMGAEPERGIIMGTCETVNGEGLRLLIELGAELCDAEGDKLAPVALALSTYCRNPGGKHEVLCILEANVDYPDTPAMALHRGRIDLLEAHLKNDPEMMSRPLTADDIYPTECGCGGGFDYGLHGTPFHLATLLHMAIDFDEGEIFDWLLEKGADPNARAAVDDDGFGGHTPLFSTVVMQNSAVSRQQNAYYTRTLLARGADPSVRASIRKKLAFFDEEEHEYRDVTAVEYGRAFHNEGFVNLHAVEALESL